MTAQVHENLIYEGDEMTMTTCPPLPAEHPRVRMVAPPGAVAARDGVPSVVFSTACWRGYLGTWEIKQGRLYLNSVVGRYEMEGGEPIFADWVSGWLVIPRGEVVEYVHMGFESVYEQELRLRVEAGAVAETLTVDNRRAPPQSWLKRLLLFNRK